MTNLKATREIKNISQKELSEKSGVSLRMIQHYEQGVKDINKAQVITALRIADALGCSIWEILELDDE